MRRLLQFIVCAVAVLAVIGCGKTAPNSNNGNGTAPNTNTANANTTAAETLPELNDAPTALAEGNRLFDINKTELAITAYKRAVELDPDLGEAWFKLGVAQALIEREKKLEAENEQVEYTPTPTPSKKDKQVVRTAKSEKSFENAVKAYKKQLSKNPNDDVAHYNLGRAYDKLDEDEDALKSLKEAVRLKPESTEYQTELGAIQIKLARYDEAVRTLKKAIEIDPENSQAEELLERADAGRRRVNFSVTPKPQSTAPGNKSNPGDAEAAPTGSENPGPVKPNPVKPAPAKPSGKVDKKGNP